LGKAILAGLDDDVVSDIVAQRGLPGRTDRTITTITGLRAQLEQIRRDGYSMDNEESMIGLRCIAAPVYDDRNRVIAAVSASGTSAEFTEADLPEMIATVKRAAEHVSLRLGHRIPVDISHQIGPH
jgi:IclR family acetate operon transcriptional repressor